MKTKKLVCGIGLNDADYVVQRNETIGYVGGKQKLKMVWKCPFYQAWKAMLERCYSAKQQDKYPTYAGCTISDEWLTFSVFKAWMENQDWEGNQLDKDLLLEGNKVYSEDTCVFVSQVVNKFANDNGTKRGEWLIGVHWDKKVGKFKSQCRNPFSGEQEYLGLFTSELEAHETWLKRKLELAKELAAEQTDERVAKALIDRYSKPQTTEDKL